MKKHLLSILLISLLASCSTSTVTSTVPSESSFVNTSSSFSSIDLTRDVDSRVFSYIAHRGFHDDTNPENSLAAFRAAKSMDLALETDVHLTKDKGLIIHHDFQVGTIGRIESNTLEYLQSNYALSNGEHLPSLDELLSTINEETPIVLEMKVPDGEDGTPLGEAVYKRIKTLEHKDRLVLISFNPDSLKVFNGTGFARGLLVSGDTNTTLFETWSQESLSNEYCDFYDLSTDTLNSTSAKAYRQKGGKIIGWTFRSQDTVNSFKNSCDGYTFEGFTPSK